MSGRSERSAWGSPYEQVLTGDPAYRHTAIRWLHQHGLALLNSFALALVIGSVTAPVLVAVGADAVARSLYRFFHLFCQQSPLRSFFVGGQGITLSPDDLTAFDDLGNRHSFVGNAQVGWKMALCERCLAIFTGLLAFGAIYGATKRRIRRAGVVGFSVLIAPLAVDGLTQFAGWRNSRWELRVCTGLLFGAGSGRFLYPRLLVPNANPRESDR